MKTLQRRDRLERAVKPTRIIVISARADREISPCAIATGNRSSKRVSARPLAIGQVPLGIGSTRSLMTWIARTLHLPSSFTQTSSQLKYSLSGLPGIGVVVGLWRLLESSAGTKNTRYKPQAPRSQSTPSVVCFS
jgi:hypothetical protein